MGLHATSIEGFDMTVPSFTFEPHDLPADNRERHEQLVDLFGQFLFWVRNRSLQMSATLLESEEAREKLGSIRRKSYDAVARMATEDKAAALHFAESTLDAFLQTLVWSLGNEGMDALLGARHAYRIEVKMEIIDVGSGETVHEEAVNRGGRFFGSYWGRWLTKYATRVGGSRTENGATPDAQ